MIASHAATDIATSEVDAEKSLGAEQVKLHAAQAGDMAAFEWLVRQHEDRLFGFCSRWLRSHEDAREVCQDAFVRAWQALPEFEGRARFSTWLYQIALNLCRDRAKSRTARQGENTMALHEMTDAPLCPQSTPIESAELQSELKKLECGLALLPEKLRAALVLTAVEGLSHEECAQVLTCSVRGVEGRVYRARQMLLEWWGTQE